MYETVEEFLGSGNSLRDLTAYDFKNESPQKEVRQERNPIKKFQKYKAPGSVPFDCDNSDGTCSLTDDIYQKLWGWSYKERNSIPPLLVQRLRCNWKRLGSDTMNSFQTIYTCAENLYWPTPQKAVKNKELKKFAALTHSIGNFTLVPFHLNPLEDRRSFNQYRGYRSDGDSKYFVYDFFDLSLKLIKENVSEEVFRNYIDTFFLDDYVDNNYNILPLLSRHAPLLQEERLPLDDPESFLPQTVDELNEYLSLVNEKIKARSKRIVKYLKKLKIKPATNVPKQSKSLAKRIKPYVILIFVLSLLFCLCALCAEFSHLAIFNSSEYQELINEYGVEAVQADTHAHIRQICLSFLKGMVWAFPGVLLLISLLVLITRLLIISFANLFLRRCRSCKKLFAMQKVGKYVVKKETISMLAELKRRDKDGQVYGTDEQYIPGTRTTYETLYRCKYCGREETLTRYRDEKNI